MARRRLGGRRSTRKQTRDHDDLDAVAALDRMPEAIAALGTVGFGVAEDERPTRLVLRDDADRQRDIHTVVFDETGSGIQALPGGRSYRYPPLEPVPIELLGLRALDDFVRS